MAITITTNNRPRDLLAFSELTPKEQGEFDYVEEEEFWAYRFARYRGNVLDVSDMQVINVAPTHTPFGVNVAPESPLAAWHGVAPDSFWSGIVARYCDDHERVILGSFYDGGEC